MTSSIIIFLLLILLNLKICCFAFIGFHDSVLIPRKNEDLPNDLKHRFMFGENGERVITSSGEFTVRYPSSDNVFFFRIQTNSTSRGSVTFCFQTPEELKSRHFECKIGQCGMKFYIFNNTIYLNHDLYSLPFYSDETIIFGYSDQDMLKFRIGTKKFREFPARCSLPHDFTSVTNENQISFDVHYHLSNAKLELATSYLVLKEKPSEPVAVEDDSGTPLSVTLGIVCAFLIPVFVVVALGEGYVLWTKRKTFKRIFSKSTPKESNPALKESKKLPENQTPIVKT